jgi:curved DNA-binding protein CbpA
MADHYEALELSRAATPSEIRLAYRNLAKLYHPDVNPKGGDSMARINLAFEILSDPERKLEYDRTLGPMELHEVRDWSDSGVKRARKAEEEAVTLAWRRTAGALDAGLFRSFYRQAVAHQRSKRTFFKAYEAFETAWAAYEFAKGLATLER